MEKSDQLSAISGQLGVRVSEPFPTFHLPRVWVWTQEFRSRVADDFGPKTLEEFMALQQARAAAGARSWGVYRDSELGGIVTFEAQSPVCGAAHCIFKKSFWGHETTVEAMRQVFDEVFAAGTRKILSLAFADNVQLLYAVRLLGFEKEGVLRKQTRRGGALVDMMALGCTHEDFQAASATGLAGMQEKLRAAKVRRFARMDVHEGRKAA